VVRLSRGDATKVIGVYFAYGGRLNLLETIEVEGILDKKSNLMCKLRSYTIPSKFLFVAFAFEILD
jgi:hypothetical protein